MIKPKIYVRQWTYVIYNYPSNSDFHRNSAGRYINSEFILNTNYIPRVGEMINGKEVVSVDRKCLVSTNEKDTFEDYEFLVTLRNNKVYIDGVNFIKGEFCKNQNDYYANFSYDKVQDSVSNWDKDKWIRIAGMYRRDY